MVEQVIRPTGLIDPEITVKPASGQVDDLLHQIRETVERGERVLVTTLTKRMAEDLTDYYRELGVRVKYLHSDIVTIERMQIIRDLRLGNSTSSSGSTFSGKVWTSRRSRWWRSSTPTRRGSSARRAP